MARISHVTTIRRVAEMLGEDEEFLHDVTLGSMDDAHGLLGLHGVEGESTIAFTDDGIEILKEMLKDDWVEEYRNPETNPWRKLKS